MKTKFGIVGCGFLGNIVADAWKKGLLEDYELVGVTSRTFASAEKTAASVGRAACADVDALLALVLLFSSLLSSSVAIGGCGARNGRSGAAPGREPRGAVHRCIRRPRVL